MLVHISLSPSKTAVFHLAVHSNLRTCDVRNWPEVIMLQRVAIKCRGVWGVCGVKNDICHSCDRGSSLQFANFSCNYCDLKRACCLLSQSFMFDATIIVLASPNMLATLFCDTYSHSIVWVSYYSTHKAHHLGQAKQVTWFVYTSSTWGTHLGKDKCVTCFVYCFCDHCLGLFAI